MSNPDSLSFFVVSFVSELVGCLPTLILSSLDKTFGTIVGIIVAMGGAYLFWKKYDSFDALLRYGIPVALALIGANLYINGIDASLVIFIAVIYCLFLIIADMLEAVFSFIHDLLPF